jgi:TolB-like protein/DNA-binding winged helix-turn-helix (wHTH) protein/cytochrome c-type biogenesis protein CcmH/NrfG
MNIMDGFDVPKDGRTDAENSPNSLRAAAIPGANDLSSLAAAGGGRLWFNGYVLDFQRGCLLAGDEEIALRPKTFEFLRHLVGNPGRLVSKDELLAAVWPNVVVTDDSLVQCVTELRRALRDHDQRLIKTVQRRGYRFEAALSAGPSAAVQCGTAAPTQLATDEVSAPTRHDPRRAGHARRTAMLAAIGAFALLIAAVGASWRWLGTGDLFMAPPPLSIAVLPFKILGDDPDQENVAAGVTIDLTTDLSRIPGAFVIAQGTAQTFKGQNVDVRQVGRDLNVRYVIKGSLRRSGDEVRIDVELIEARSRRNLWTERFKLERDEIAAWQDEIGGRIANALNFRLARIETERTLRERRDYPDAYDLTTRGWALIYTAKSPENYDAARKLFRQALGRNPESANALAGLGWSSAISVLNGWSESPAADVAVAQAAVAQLLVIDPNHVVGNHVRGFLLRLQRRTGAAREAFRTVAALNPNFAPAHAQLGVTAIESGRPEEAVEAIERAIRISPRDPDHSLWLSFIGMAELHRGRLQEAVFFLGRALEVDTSTATGVQRAYLASALMLVGRTTEARAALAEFRKAKPSATIASLRAAARSTDAVFIAQQERFFEGLRMAGLPE